MLSPPYGQHTAEAPEVIRRQRCLQGGEGAAGWRNADPFRGCDGGDGRSSTIPGRSPNMVQEGRGRASLNDLLGKGTGVF